jgi:hypothetical protein
MRIPGTLLLVAAMLKLWGLGAGPLGRVGILSLPEVQLAIIEFEVFLGVWIWSGKYHIAAWATALVTFADVYRR